MRAVARYLDRRGIVRLHRVHEKPDPKKVLEFEEMAQGFRLHARSEPTSSSGEVPSATANRNRRHAAIAPAMAARVRWT